MGSLHIAMWLKLLVAAAVGMFAFCVAASTVRLVRRPSDGDGMNDGWEYRHMDAGFDPAVDNASDANPDSDGMTNGSGDGYPDYDYELDCATNALPPNVVVQDPDGLFGTDETSTTFGGVRLDGIFDRRNDCADSAEGRRFNPSAEARSINRHALSRKRQVLHWKLARADTKKVY